MRITGNQRLANWPGLPVRRPRAPGPGKNVVLASAASPAARKAAIAQRLGHLSDYVIFANHEKTGEYVQFARTRAGTTLMEVASGAYGGDGIKLAADSLAVKTLASLGLHAKDGENFRLEDLTAAPGQVADWVEGIFINLFRLDEGFTMDVLGDPAGS